MELRQLKKEVELLPHLGTQAEQFEASWVQPLRRNASVQALDVPTKKEVHRKLSEAQGHILGLKSSQVIHDKMQQYVRYLIELKLSSLNGDRQKSRYLNSALNKEEFLQKAQLQQEMEQYEEHLAQLQAHYDELNELLQTKLPLEEMLWYMELPHRRYLQGLLKIAKQQQAVLRHLERHFQAITMDMSLKKAPLR